MKKTFFCLLFSFALSATFAQSSKYRLLIGTYTNTGKSQGIYSYNIDLKADTFTLNSICTGITNPSFLTISTDKKKLYSVCENIEGSAVNAYSLEQKTGKLNFINTSLTKSAGPCYISITQRHVFTANYGGGSISVFGRNKNGFLTDNLQLIQHSGKSINNDRQKEPHVHQVLVTPNKKYIIANDLGTDKVIAYKYNKNEKYNILTPYDTLSVKPGSGPRHAVFNKNGTKLYLVHEIDGSISVLNFKNGKLTLLQQTTLDKNNTSINRAADIHITTDQKFIYATNRANVNNISCFSVDKKGMLALVQQISTGGSGPRNFAITPDDHYLFVANQFTNNIVIFKRNIKNGTLTDTGKQLQIGAPVCLLFY